ncbi:sensor histidine kinase N-terminal domain-containing protein, partial [Pseudomonas aeruginosa]
DTLRTDDYPALAKFYDGVYQGVDVRVVSLRQPVSEPSMSGMAEIRVAETEGARERMARSLMTETLLRLGVLGAALTASHTSTSAPTPRTPRRSRVSVIRLRAMRSRAPSVSATRRSAMPLMRGSLT